MTKPHNKGGKFCFLEPKDPYHQGRESSTLQQIHATKLHFLIGSSLGQNGLSPLSLPKPIYLASTEYRKRSMKLFGFFFFFPLGIIYYVFGRKFEFESLRNDMF